MAEIPFEKLAVALEATRGTAIAAPTHLLNLVGTLRPMQTKYRPNDSTGTLAEYNRSLTTRKWGEFEAEGALDVYTLPVLLNAIVKPLTSPSTPVGATNARLWSFVPTMTSDDLKTLTTWWGDPNIQMLRAAFAAIDELTITNDATSEDEGATMSVSGRTSAVSQVSTPSIPASLNAPLVVGSWMQVWLDTSSAIGTTAVTGRVLSAEHTFPTGITYKYLAEGTSASMSYSALGRNKRHITTTIRMELPDMVQYTLFENGTTVKARVRHNGPLIETGFYSYVEVDTYGPIDAIDWGEYEGSNRTIELTIESQVDSTLGADFRIAVQNDRTTL